MLDIIFDIAVFAHRKEVFFRRKCLRCGKFCHFYSIKPGSDIFGKPYQTPATAPYYSCTICGREVAAGRYVPHLEKCLGNGRLSNRPTQRTNGYGAAVLSYTNAENDISSEDEIQHKKKKRKPTNGSTKSGPTKLSHLKLKKSNTITSNSSDIDLQSQN